MTPEAILEQPARVLTQAQREKYFTDGFVSAEEIVPTEILAELQRATAGVPGQEPPCKRLRRHFRHRTGPLCGKSRTAPSEIPRYPA